MSALLAVNRSLWYICIPKLTSKKLDNIYIPYTTIQKCNTGGPHKQLNWLVLLVHWWDSQFSKWSKKKLEVADAKKQILLELMDKLYVRNV